MYIRFSTERLNKKEKSFLQALVERYLAIKIKKSAAQGKLSMAMDWF